MNSFAIHEQQIWSKFLVGDGHRTFLFFLVQSPGVL